MSERLEVKLSDIVPGDVPRRKNWERTLTILDSPPDCKYLNALGIKIVETLEYYLHSMAIIESLV